jgi:hypothetical protein
VGAEVAALTPERWRRDIIALEAVAQQLCQQHWKVLGPAETGVAAFAI